MSTIKGKNTRDAIYSQAVEVYRKQRFSDVTAAMIVDGLGVSKSTFYTYFSSPLDLVPQMLANFCWSHDRGPDAWFTLNNDLPFHLVATQKNLVQHFELKGWVLRIGHEIQSTRPFKPWADFRNSSAEVYRKNIERQQNFGTIRPEINANRAGFSIMKDPAFQ